MAVVNMHKAKTGLSDLVARAQAGEEIVIARRNQPVMKLVPVKDRDDSGRAPGVLTYPGEDGRAVNWFEQALDEYISKSDIADYYRQYPAEWDEMREMVGFAEDEQGPLELTGLSAAI